MPQPSEVALRNHRLLRITSLLWVIVFALALAFCYFASSFCITLILASFLSILIDPLISFLERWHVPRSVSAALLIGFSLVGIVLLTYASYNRLSTIADSLPSYAAHIRGIVRPLNEKITKVEESAGSLSPETPAKKIPEVKVRPPSAWPSYLASGFGSVSEMVLILGVLPFLMFFMLIRKEKWYQTVAQLLGPRLDAAEFANRLAQMIRDDVPVPRRLFQSRRGFRVPGQFRQRPRPGHQRRVQVRQQHRPGRQVRNDPPGDQGRPDNQEDGSCQPGSHGKPKGWKTEG